MKRLVLIVTAVLVVVLGVISCTQTPPPQPEPDIPRYTADQVIYVATSSPYTSCGYIKNKASWTVEYQGNGLWLVTKTCFTQYGQAIGTEKYTFYENTGKLIKR